MALLSSVLIDRVRKTLVDPNGTGWSDDELYDYLSAAESAVCNVKPDAYTRQEAVTLIPGPVQVTPDDCISLLAIYYNAVSGEIINQVGLDLQNQANRSWPATTPAGEVQEYMTDVRNPRRYLVYPPNDGTGSVMMLYGAEPPALVAGAPSQTINVPDIFQNALWAYVCALAYAKNTKRQDVAKSNTMLGMFAQFMGLRSAGQVAVAPKLDNTEPQ
jgi:hypothetical protein